MISMMDRLFSIYTITIYHLVVIRDHHTGPFKDCRRCDLFAVLWDVSTGRRDPHGCCVAERRNDPPVGSVVLMLFLGMRLPMYPMDNLWIIYG